MRFWNRVFNVSILTVLILNVGWCVYYYYARAQQNGVRVLVESNKGRDALVDNLKKQFDERGYFLEVAREGEPNWAFRFVGISEGGLMGNQASIVALTPGCEVVGAVTRSGRLSQGGAFNAAAKELVKNLQSSGHLR